jgi:hypothetical protein
LLAPGNADLPKQKKGCALVPSYDVAPCNISLSLFEDNIIIGKRQANNIVMEPCADDPLTYSQAIFSKPALQWIAAIDNELQNMERHTVYSIKPLPPGCKPLSCKWVFKTKFNIFGKIDKFKARLVFRVFLQKEGIDYTATFSPTGRLQTLRTVLAILAYLDLEVHQMDMHCAFLNGKPDCDIFIEVPEGFTVDLKPGEGLYLNQLLYGLKQSPRMWHIALSKFFAQINFFPMVSDPCLFVSNKKYNSAFIFVHFDDLVIGGRLVDWVKRLLCERFEMVDMGECVFVLGI